MSNKKRLFALLLSIIMLISVFSVNSISVSAAGNPYPYWQTFTYNNKEYTTITCTYYAWQQVYDRLGIALPSWGNGGNWYDNARASGYSVGSTPKANSLAVWKDGGWGHVAFVISANGNSFVYNEGGTANRRANSLGIYEGHSYPDGYTNAPYGFIYLVNDGPTKVSQRYQGSDYNEGWYEGEWSNGKPNGYGKLTYDDFDDGKYYYITSGGVTYKALCYEGYFSNGYRNGSGVLTYEGGYKEEGTYYGQWTAGKTVFEGKMWYIHGSTEGYWPLTTVATSAVDAKSTYGTWVSTHKHDYKVKVITPTCTAQGYTIYTCSCGDSYKDNYTKALGHEWSTVWTVDTAETYDHAGSKSHHCMRCDAKTDVTEIPKKVSPVSVFSDVKDNSWFRDAVNYVVTNGLMNGTSADKFSPNGTMTRAMLVTVLWRLKGSPSVNTRVPFTDLKQDWYKTAVAWAYQNEIVNGTSVDKFSPNGAVTREQMAAIFYRYNSGNKPFTKIFKLPSFPDASNVHSYAETAMSWAVSEGLIGGVAKNGKSYLDPRGSATRAQVATILQRFCEKH